MLVLKRKEFNSQEQKAINRKYVSDKARAAGYNSDSDLNWARSFARYEDDTHSISYLNSCKKSGVNPLMARINYRGGLRPMGGEKGQRNQQVNTATGFTGLSNKYGKHGGYSSTSPYVSETAYKDAREHYKDKL